MGINKKRRNGFEGEKMISVPDRVWKNAKNRFPILFPLYISFIGYFPHASFHYRERRKGCTDNILIYCIKGKGHCILDGERFEVHANQYILIPASDRYIRYWSDIEDPWTIYWVHFTGANIGTFNSSLAIQLCKGPINTPFNEKGIEIWDNIYQTLEASYTIENLCNACFCLYHLLATFLFTEQHIKSDTAQKDIVQKTILTMRNNLTRKLHIDEFSAIHNLSTSHFSSLFKKSTGMPPMDYFTHLKMQRACQLLYHKDSRIKSVALELGYPDPYYFSRVFKKFIGSSPSEYKFSIHKPEKEQ